MRYVSGHNFLRKLCYGSKKWRWLNQWMISNLRALSEEPLVQTLSYLTWELLQNWTNSSRIPASRKRSVWENESSQRRPFPPRKTDCLLDLRILSPTILSRITQTYVQLFFEMMIFRNSIQNGTKFYCRWHKSHLMTSWVACHRTLSRQNLYRFHGGAQKPWDQLDECNS